MTILGIETSCDETAAAIVKDGTQLISNVVASSQQMHAKFGGIIPENAAREQITSIIPVIKEALVCDIDAIAVTVGPGLIGSLLVGVETAKTFAYAWNKPLIPVNHLVGHIYANWLVSKPQFPALVLLVSGGHSELILMEGHGKFKYLGGTRDDAAGECFDKCARLLNLGYPGGVAIEKAAIKNNLYKLPRPMINDKSFDFSFSGLKTAVANSPKDNVNYLAYELQEAITDVLVIKTRRAAEKYQVKNILLAGGVAANKRLREKIPEALFPPFALCTDNAAYIASAAYFNQKVVPWEKVNADPSLSFS
ncbi:MAG: tRNA (adenosine(37)-N6)-threonylcarbamoyltransferase complex transferase subunit TsaD [bacterium]|nr:tRNA (adenosine(37)-N6)-threonylcarbamoyltransferase complex transferase subunit TsaD [bacterium]